MSFNRSSHAQSLYALFPVMVAFPNGARQVPLFV